MENNKLNVKAIGSNEDGYVYLQNRLALKKSEADDIINRFESIKK